MSREVEVEVEVDRSYFLNLINLKCSGVKLTEEEQIIFDREHEKARQRQAELEQLLEGILRRPNGDKNVKSSD